MRTILTLCLALLSGGALAQSGSGFPEFDPTSEYDIVTVWGDGPRAFALVRTNAGAFRCALGTGEEFAPLTNCVIIATPEEADTFGGQASDEHRAAAEDQAELDRLRNWILGQNNRWFEDRVLAYFGSGRCTLDRNDPDVMEGAFLLHLAEPFELSPETAMALSDTLLGRADDAIRRLGRSMALQGQGEGIVARTACR